MRPFIQEYQNHLFNFIDHHGTSRRSGAITHDVEYYEEKS